MINDENEEENFDDFPLTYSIDNAILMHRDAHFGGDFSIMLDYYKKGGQGVCKEFEIERIEELAETERNSGRDLAAVMLSGAEAEKVADARQAYKTLRDVYEITNPKSIYPKLMADLILAEEEEAPAAIQAVIAEKGAIVPFLIDLMRNENFCDPLFPGYGQAPTLAAKCLGMIGDKRAIISLFEAIGEGDFFHEDMVLDALHDIGDPAKEFLLKVLHGHPITRDNEQAAIALIEFKDDPQVSQACLKLLKEIDLNQYAPFATYLILACEGLPASQRSELLELAKNPTTPKMIHQDIAALAIGWKDRP